MARPLKEDLTGKRFGRLFVDRRNGSAKGQALWFCKCDCGTELNVAGSHLRRGNTKSCGCWRREAPVINKTTHGHGSHKPLRRSRLYLVWNAMKQRCHNPNQHHYHRYGGRGITVCDEWRQSFAAFYRDMGDPPNDGQRWTLDRIDVNKGYEPGNVRWATYSEQQRNKRPVVDRAALIAECRRIVLACAENAAEAAEAKDATDYIAGYQDAVVDCDEALRELLGQTHR